MTDEHWSEINASKRDLADLRERVATSESDIRQLRRRVEDAREESRQEHEAQMSTLSEIKTEIDQARGGLRVGRWLVGLGATIGLLKVGDWMGFWHGLIGLFRGG